MAHASGGRLPEIFGKDLDARLMGLGYDPGTEPRGTGRAALADRRRQCGWRSDPANDLGVRRRHLLWAAADPHRKDREPAAVGRPAHRAGPANHLPPAGAEAAAP